MQHLLGGTMLRNLINALAGLVSSIKVSIGH
jgi:hypothetical protein